MFYTIETIKPICDDQHQKGKKIVLATGFFDLLHDEHINFLQKAKLSGDVLIVAVESDERARILKGEGRPVQTQLVRCQHISELSAESATKRFYPRGKLVDYVVLLTPDFDHFEAYDDLMSTVKPHIYAVSSHTSHQKNKDFLAEKYGGHLVVVHEFNPEISTTQIIQGKNQL
jgi:D-beta-D-heptose 7-phosphate kinase/D-beta-D-heptose 1-phosphate adenosyltransferase